MRIHIIACRVLTRELEYYASQSEHATDITWLPQGLHNTPDKLRAMVKASLEDLYAQVESAEMRHAPDVIALGYGLCSNGIVGIEARDIPIVVPRTDDCIALFMGSQARYLELFEKYNGTYWLNNGWIETSFYQYEGWEQRLLCKYAELYGEDNAEFLLEQEKLWVKNYNTCGYITSPVYHNPEYPGIARRFARENGWEYVQIEGNTRMLQKLTRGAWDDREFLICPPGHRIEASFDERKIKAVPCAGTGKG